MNYSCDKNNEEEDGSSNLGPKYKILEKLGEGSFGNVFKAENTQTGQVVAIKCLKDQVSLSSVTANPEINALCILRKHPNIVNLEDVFQQSGYLRLVFEYMDSNLLHCIEDRRTRGVSFSEPEIRHVCFQLLLGLDYMHNTSGLMHRDLKPENILVTGNDVKIADLGSAAKLNNTVYRDYVTTRWYRAPEVLFGHVVYNSSVDMWALGAILAEMYLLRPLFPGFNKNDQLKQITRFPWSHESLSRIMPTASYEGIELILSLLSLDPKKRPTAREALNKFFYEECFQSRFSSFSRWSSSSCAQISSSLPPLPSYLVV